MSDIVLLKVYYFGQILLQTSEGVNFICENPLDVVIPFTISFEEFKGVICEKIDSERERKISCILYRYRIPVFGGFVQFQTKYVTGEASMQEMLSMYIKNRAQISFIELYVEFEQSEADRNIVREDYNSDSEEEFESNYEIVGPDGDEDQGNETMAPDVANALVNEVSFEEPSFMRILDLEAMHVPEFPEYECRYVIHRIKIPIVADGEFTVGMEFSSREAIIKPIKEYTIRRSVDYRVYEFEPLTFYAKCTQYGSGIFEDGAGVRSALPAFTGTGRGSTYVAFDVTVVSFRWTGSPVDMCSHVVPTNAWISKCMCMMCIKWTKFGGCTELGLGHWVILLHGLLTTDLGSYRIRT
ncbi:hypothetical protein Ahy_A01g003451 [Arachis hypogaea]|uniref:Transposase MuDR plant domain-containing protein n=1 Tax=Arachis hypogaea TaxID=3818 RepID=A0A445ESX3_ARAHY|nr:hypothetical protein Ahy_A01g003451 [Arachis hypogaea]